MSFFQSFTMALKNILSSKMRSLLTMLGIIIGVGAVIVIIGLGNGMEIYMTEQFQSMGTNLLTVSLFGRGSSREVTVDDMYDIVLDNPKYLSAASPNIPVAGSVKVGNETLSSTKVSGVGEDYGAIQSYTVDGGRFLRYVDILRRQNVCVVGSYIADEWYVGAPLGEIVKINGIPFTIVGVLAEEAEGNKGGTDDAIYIPYSVATKLNGSAAINNFYFTVVSEDTVTEAKEVISDRLEQIYGSTDAFFILSMSEILSVMNDMLNMVIYVLAAIAGISLVVGGIGIMNIMLVSVSERTREIGIRKALGAKQRTIMLQFVIEAATTSAIGGALGIGLGYLLSSVAGQIIIMASGTDMPVVPSTTAIALAFGVSAGIGIIFGYLPAKKAAALNPIDALRYD